MSSQLTRTRLSSTLEHSALVFKERAVLTKTSVALPGSIGDHDAADGENHGSHDHDHGVPHHTGKGSEKWTDEAWPELGFRQMQIFLCFI